MRIHKVEGWLFCSVIIICTLVCFKTSYKLVRAKSSSSALKAHTPASDRTALYMLSYFNHNNMCTCMVQVNITQQSDDHTGKDSYQRYDEKLKDQVTERIRGPTSVVQSPLYIILTFKNYATD